MTKVNGCISNTLCFQYRQASDQRQPPRQVRGEYLRRSKHFNAGKRPRFARRLAASGARIGYVAFPAHLQTLICLPSSDDKFACEISLSDLPNFFDPAFKPKILDSAEIVDFHVMRIH